MKKEETKKEMELENEENFMETEEDVKEEKEQKEEKKDNFLKGLAAKAISAAPKIGKGIVCALVAGAGAGAAAVVVSKITGMDLLLLHKENFSIQEATEAAKEVVDSVKETVKETVEENIA